MERGRGGKGGGKEGRAKLEGGGGRVGKAEMEWGATHFQPGNEILEKSSIEVVFSRD